MNEKMKPRKIERIEIPTSTSKRVLQMMMVKTVTTRRSDDQSQVGTCQSSKSAIAQNSCRGKAEGKRRT